MLTKIEIQVGLNFGPKCVKQPQEAMAEVKIDLWSKFQSPFSQKLFDRFSSNLVGW